jgi:SAM-dependent methyltransferase
MRVNIISKLHQATRRDYAGRMADEKVKCMKVARQFDERFFDGPRRYGYGGYKYDGRFKSVAKDLIERYDLTEESEVLDFGCAKGFLIKELQDLCGCKCYGYDVSGYALQNAVVDIEKPAPNQEFDLIVSMGTLHNMHLPELKVLLQYFQRAAEHSYITVDSYRNIQELYNLQCWTLTCNVFLTPKEWEFLFREWGYAGDYEFLFFK